MIAFPDHLGSLDAGAMPAAEAPASADEIRSPISGDPGISTAGPELGVAPAFALLPPASDALPTIRIPGDTDALGDEIARLAAHINAATYRFLVLIEAFDKRMEMGWGFRSTAHWLSWRTDMAPGTAREKVRVARALPDLPLISAAMAQGKLSFSKARALTRIATPENEAALLDVARHSTAAQLEKLVQNWLLMDRLADAGWEEQRHESRFLQLYPDHDGSYVLRGRLDPEVGALLEKALEWASEALFREGREVEELMPKATPPTFDQRRADAMGLVAERAFAAATASAEGGAEDGAEETAGWDSEASGDGAAGREAGVSEETDTGDQPSKMPSTRADRFQVVVHVAAADLLGGPGPEPSEEHVPSESVPAGTPGVGSGRVTPHIMTRTGPLAVSMETVRMLASDASLVVMAHDEEGGVLDVGRKRRTIPPAIRRALEYRDKGCRFPGCGCGYTEGHHIIPWEKGGETRLGNLVSLCWRHHRAVHKGGYSVESDFRFFDPLGRPLKEVPDTPPLPADPVGELVRTHAEAGIEPDGWTATPDWHGESLDHAYAIEVLWTPSRKER